MIAVLFSGKGSNLDSIIKSGIKVAFAVTDKANAGGIQIAQEHNIPVIVSKSLSDIEYFTSIMCEMCAVDLVVLAGFMRLLSKKFVEDHKVVNIHPSILPAFPGKDAIEKSWATMKDTGITIHWVDEGMDTGKIIEQVPITPDKDVSLRQYKENVQAVEHLWYPDVIRDTLEYLNAG